MKKILCAFMLLIGVTVARAQDQSATDLYHCFDGDPAVIGMLRDPLEQFSTLQRQIERSVTDLIEEESIHRSNEKLVFVNLHSVVRTAQRLQDLDELYDAFFAEKAPILAASFLERASCLGTLDIDRYRELVLDYLEYSVFRLQDHYASRLFAKYLEFNSALQLVQEQQQRWLASASGDLEGEDPSFDQPINQELYWPVLSRDFDLELSDPEPELQAYVGKGKSLKDVLKFIFDNWTEIKGILDWLTNNLFFDCHPSATARIRLDKENVPGSLSPGWRRQYRYAVAQNGVLMDGKSTRTRISGKLKLYKKRPVGWAEDRVSMAGISYCALQWNACEKLPWPANGVPFVQAPFLQPFKSKINQVHPYALTIRDQNREFLTFQLFFNRQLLRTIPLLGSGRCD